MCLSSWVQPLYCHEIQHLSHWVRQNMIPELQITFLYCQKDNNCAKDPFGYTLYRTPTNSLPRWSTFNHPSRTNFCARDMIKHCTFPCIILWHHTAANFTSFDERACSCRGNTFIEDPLWRHRFAVNFYGSDILAPLRWNNSSTKHNSIIKIVVLCIAWV